MPTIDCGHWNGRRTACPTLLDQSFGEVGGAGGFACRWKLISIAHPNPENGYTPEVIRLRPFDGNIPHVGDLLPRNRGGSQNQLAAALRQLDPAEPPGQEILDIGLVAGNPVGFGADQGRIVRLGQLRLNPLIEETQFDGRAYVFRTAGVVDDRSEEHTSELQSPCNLVCRLLLEKKKNNYMRGQQLGL